MKNMFCFQCEQTQGGVACEISGVCGKTAETANLQDDLTSTLVMISRTIKERGRTAKSDRLVIDGLFTGITNVSFDDASLNEMINEFMTCDCVNHVEKFDLKDIWTGDEDIRSLKTLLLLGLRGMAAYTKHANVLGFYDEEVQDWFYKGLYAIGSEHTVPELIDLLMEFGQINLKAMALLHKANTESYGSPVPTPVTMKIEKGPFIVISGHDLHDMEQLLQQTEGKGIDVYTHGEMLPGHSYPTLKKYAHLKGHFGTAWNNQQKEFHEVPGAFLFTTNCLMKPRASYADRVFTTSVVRYPGLKHIEAVEGKKDFSAVIEKALELGGYDEAVTMTGVNGGSDLLTGFGYDTVMSVAGTVIDAVKSGDLKHIFLVGGCDGAKPGRSYFTDFVKQTPSDTLVLTLGCGKYRINDLQLGDIGGIPRILDMGQCNDSYSAIMVAVELAKVFECDVNDLPLSLVISWYEQKAVCVLLTLLSLGVKNIHLGPTLPAFVSPNVLNVLVENFGVSGISTPEADLAKLLQ